jgi:hypothetical protein
MSEEIGPAIGSTVSFVNPNSGALETAIVASRTDNDGNSLAILNFTDGSTLQVAVTEIQS